jgi:hypothetical protein
MTVGSQQLKFGETYAKSARTGQSGLRNWIIRFCQQNHKNRNIQFFQTRHIDKKTYINNDFKTFTHTYLHKQDIKRIGYNPNI